MQWFIHQHKYRKEKETGCKNISISIRRTNASCHTLGVFFIYGKWSIHLHWWIHTIICNVLNGKHDHLFRGYTSVSNLFPLYAGVCLLSVFFTFECIYNFSQKWAEIFRGKSLHTHIWFDFTNEENLLQWKLNLQSGLLFAILIYPSNFSIQSQWLFFPETCLNCIMRMLPKQKRPILLKPKVLELTVLCVVGTHFMWVNFRFAFIVF